MPSMDADTPGSVLGQSDAFLATLEKVSRVAALRQPVLVIGERGSGKELIAARLHYLSRRWQAPLVKFNCAALNEDLIDSELFGHVAGAFTGAARNRPGRFEAADGGSLFLDELSSMSPRLQEKLLRVVEYGEFERLGSSETLKVDVRLIGAANVDLPDLARRGEFRPDLLDRLAFDVITVPPLRARRDDILLLAQVFAENMAKELGREVFAGFAPAARQELLAYDWPGNVRELRNVVERAVYRLDDAERPVQDIEFDPFASPYRPASQWQPQPTQAPARHEPGIPLLAQRAPVPAPPAKTGYAEAVAAFQRGLLEQALGQSRHNQRKAARMLGLTYDQLRGQLRRHGLLGASRRTHDLQSAAGEFTAK